MSNYIEPTEAEFDSAQQAATDILEQTAPTVLTKVGSVVHELVIRPLAYLVSWAVGNLDDLRKKSSVAYLKTSQATENEIADLVASNYFVERRQGTPAKGTITLTLNQQSWRIPNGSSFTVGGVPVHTPKQCMILPNISDIVETNQNVLYIQSKQIGNTNTYMASIPVETDEVGNFEIPIGMEVVVNFTENVIETAELSSPITGGSETETDAEMMQRAEYNTAEAGIGTYYGLLKKFNKAPVPVLSLWPVYGDQEPLYRARYNTVNINPGGFVDCYMKTENQPTIVELESGTISAAPEAVTRSARSGSEEDTTETQEEPGNAVTVNVYAGTISIPEGRAISCLYGLDSLTVAGGSVSNVKTTFGPYTGTGTRLSTDQTTTITFQSTVEPTAENTTLFVAYMPGIDQLQAFIDSDAEAFIGLDIKCKAAVPVAVKVNCVVQSADELTDEDLETLKQTITDTINALPVGTKAVNFSDLRNACATAMPNVDLRLPCVLTGVSYTKDGRKTLISSNTGLLDITVPTTEVEWGYQMCYFYTCNDFVELSVL